MKTQDLLSPWITNGFKVIQMYACIKNWFKIEIKSTKLCTKSAKVYSKL